MSALPAWGFSFVLVLCRCGAAAMLMPGVGEIETPAIVRAGFTLALVLLVLPGVGLVAPVDGWACATMVAAELVCGGVLGWLARCITLALPMAGQIISFMTGLSSVVSPDPALGQSSAIMRLFAIAAPVLVLKTGLWTLPVAALSGSYGLVAPGHLIPLTDSVESAAVAVAQAFGLALRLASPFVIASVVWQFALGLLARVDPSVADLFRCHPGADRGWRSAAWSAVGRTDRGLDRGCPGKPQRAPRPAIDGDRGSDGGRNSPAASTGASGGASRHLARAASPCRSRGSDAGAGVRGIGPRDERGWPVGSQSGHAGWHGCRPGLGRCGPDHGHPGRTVRPGRAGRIPRDIRPCKPGSCSMLRACAPTSAG